MERICAKAEADGDPFMTPSGYVGGDTPADAIIGAATYVSLRDTVGPRMPEQIWCFTRTGRTAELLSLTRPGVPIVAFTLSPIVARRLAVRRGVTPVVLAANAKTGTLIERMEFRLAIAARRRRGQDRAACYDFWQSGGHQSPRGPSAGQRRALSVGPSLCCADDE